MKPEKTDTTLAYAATLMNAIADNYTLLYPDCLGNGELFLERIAAKGERPNNTITELPPCINLAIADVMNRASPTPLIERVIRLDYLLRQYLGAF